MPGKRIKNSVPAIHFFRTFDHKSGEIKEFVLSLHMMTENNGALRAGYVIRRGLLVQKHSIHHGKY